MNDFTDVVRNNTKDATQKKHVKTIHLGKVINNTTKAGKIDPARRVQARIEDLDNELVDDKLIWCFPLVPSTIDTIPEIGTAVFIILEDVQRIHGRRFYTGPITIGHGDSGDGYDNIKESL